MADHETVQFEISTSAFEGDAGHALAALQAALGAVLEALPEHPRRAPELGRQLGLERNLAWKIFRLIHERDVLAAGRFVPGAASIEAFVTAAAKAGVRAELLEPVAGAARNYADVVRRHAGDKMSADIMLGARTGESGELALRRSAFRSMSYLTGVQAQAQVQVFIFAPVPGDPDRFDGVSINGYVGLTRMRPDAPVVIHRSMVTDDAGTALAVAGTEPLDGPSPDGEVVPLLREFCSTPLPRFKRVPAERGFIESELEAGPVGRTGAITFMAGTIIRSMASRYRDEHNATMGLVARVRTPAAVLVCDVLAHEAILGDARARAVLYNDLFGDALRRVAGRERYRLPWAPAVEHLGTGSASVQTPEVPRHARMLQHVMDRMGWDSGRFNAYRARLEFPFTPTSLFVEFDLLER